MLTWRGLFLINIWGYHTCKIFLKYILRMRVNRSTTSLNSISSNPPWPHCFVQWYIVHFLYDWKKTVRTSNNLSVRFLPDSTTGLGFLFLSLILLLLLWQVKKIFWATFTELIRAHHEHYEYSKAQCGDWRKRAVIGEIEMICTQGAAFTIIIFPLVTFSQISYTFKSASFSCKYWLTSVENALQRIHKEFLSYS